MPWPDSFLESDAKETTITTKMWERMNEWIGLGQHHGTVQ